jgi:hypothetical protein
MQCIENYRYRLSIISPFLGLSNYRFLLRKLSITHDNLIFEQKSGISTKSKYFFEKFNIFKRSKSDVSSPDILGKALKTVPFLLLQLSILSIKTFKKLFWGDF